MQTPDPIVSYSAALDKDQQGLKDLEPLLLF